MNIQESPYDLKQIYYVQKQELTIRYESATHATLKKKKKKKLNRQMNFL